jgi:RNA polymerase sigma-70 factor (ECF subfamily)
MMNNALFAADAEPSPRSGWQQAGEKGTTVESKLNVRKRSADEIALAYMPLGRKVAWSYAGRGAEYEDLVQEAFMKVWINRDKLNETLSIEDYLFILVKRAAINFIRDRKFAETLTQELGERIGGDASSDRPAETRDLIRSIHTCVEKMPPQRRKVFLMSRRESLSNKEIAQKLSLSEKTVERHITLALTDLRKKHLS